MEWVNTPRSISVSFGSVVAMPLSGRSEFHRIQSVPSKLRCVPSSSRAHGVLGQTILDCTRLSKYEGVGRDGEHILPHTSIASLPQHVLVVRHETTHIKIRATTAHVHSGLSKGPGQLTPGCRAEDSGAAQPTS